MGRRGTMLDQQQISAWPSVVRSQMGDVMLPPPRCGGFDQHLTPDVIAWTRQQGQFKKPFQVSHSK